MAIIKLNSERHFPKIGKEKISTLTILIQYTGGSSLTGAKKQENKSEVIQIRKEEIKLPVFIDNMVVYVENPKKSSKKLLKLRNEFNMDRKTNMDSTIKIIQKWLGRNVTKHKSCMLKTANTGEMTTEI